MTEGVHLPEHHLCDAIVFLIGNNRKKIKRFSIILRHADTEVVQPAQRKITFDVPEFIDRLLVVEARFV